MERAARGVGVAVHVERQPGRPGDVFSPWDLLPAGTRLSFPPRNVRLTPSPGEGWLL